MVAFIEAFRDQFGVGPMCRALRQAGVAISPSGYYAARARPPPARAVRDAALEKQILRVYKDYAEDGVKPRNLRMACSGGAC